MKNIIRLVVLMVITTVAPLTANADDFAEIKSTIQKYFDGTEQGKLELLSEAFLPTAEIQYVLEDGTLGRLPFPEYLTRFTQGRQTQRKGRLVSIDVTGNAATAKVEIFMASNDRVYTDYILMLKLAGGWRISNKVATFRPKF